LEGRAETPDGTPAHLKAFTWWMLGRRGWEVDILNEVSSATGAGKLPDHAAAAGFACHALGHAPHDSTPIQDHLEWLSARQYFLPNRPAHLERDGVAVLGLSLAITTLTDVGEYRRWLDEFITRALGAFPVATWESSFILAARIVLDPTREAAALPTMSPEVAVALRAKGLLGSYGTKGPTAWNAVAGMDGLDEGSARAATLLVAFDRLVADSLPARLANVEVEDVRRIILALPRAMKRWTWDDAPKTPRSAVGRWEIENEYHVQNMLWAILAPLFPDLDDEEYLKSLGQLQPRYDLAIPSLDLIIEVKFIREGKSFSKVIGEIAEDVTLYLRSDTPWRHLIPVVWDNSSRTEEHYEFLSGLRRLDGVADAVVISRPARMMRQTGSGSISGSAK
jgi:hypothetical protein